jgi:3-hydroxyisobutyrate dehydrogenase-like beta-hydroxyacid dehydrogenase
MSQPPILFVGIGRIGLPIVRRMVAHGLNVHVYDDNAVAIADVERHGAIGLTRDAISRLTYARVVLCLPEPGIATTLIGNWMKNGLPKDAIVADLTTMPPSTAKRHAEMLAESGAIYLDTPVTGGQRGAESGNLVVIAGGPGSAFEAMLPILRVIGETVHHAGQVGSASLVKAVNQFVYLSYNFAFAKGLQLAGELGLPDAVVVDTLTKGAAGHPLINDRLPSILRSNFDEGFLLKRCLKDLDCLELTTEQANPAIDAFERLRNEIRRAIEDGLGDRDILILSRQV